MNMGVVAAGLLITAAVPGPFQGVSLVLIPMTQVGLTLLMEDH
jgi:hypothetical protein